MLTSTGGLRAAPFQKKEIEMRENTGEIVKDIAYKNDRHDLKVIMVEDRRHVCHKRDYVRFIVSFMNFDSGAIKQTIHRDFISAHAAVEAYCDEAEEIMSEVAETDLWNEMEAEDLAEALASL
jgi:hypothetical protein